MFKEAKNLGYKIRILYLFIPAPDFAIKRIEERAKHGGHNIDDENVKRRFYRGIYNLFNFYWDIVDNIVFINNSDIVPYIVAEKRNGNLIVFNEIEFKKIEEIRENIR